MSRRALLSALALLALCAAWSVAIERPSLYLLRELYRLGEWVGLTATYPAPGSRLAGQIMGFNYSQPPGWYEFIARSLTAAAALAPFLLPGLWSHRNISARWREVPSASRWSLLRGPLAALTAGIVFAAIDIKLGYWLWSQFLALGELLGGSVTRISGQLVIGPRGPFYGSTLTDNLGNLAVRHGPHIVCTLVATAAAILLHTLLWRADSRRAASGSCMRCGYDLSATPAPAPCPECGSAGRMQA
jgi:hypothetical protein